MTYQEKIRAHCLALVAMEKGTKYAEMLALEKELNLQVYVPIAEYVVQQEKETVFNLFNCIGVNGTFNSIEHYLKENGLTP